MPRRSYRRSRRMRPRRYRRGMRLPRSFARSDMFLVRAGRPVNTLQPGDCWVKRRVCRLVTVSNASNTGFSFTTQDLWNALVSGPSPSNSVQQPYTSSSVLQVRVSSIKIFCSAAAPFQVDVGNSFLQVAAGSTPVKSFFAYPNSLSSITRMALKFPVPQQTLWSVSQPDTNRQTMFTIYPPANSTNLPFSVYFSLKMKV